MLYDGYNAWDECPEADNCELIRSFLELVDAMVRDIQHLKAEAVRARYRFAMETDPERKQITTVDILSDLDMPHYDSLAYQEFSRICYDGGDPMAFKDFTDSMVQLVNNGELVPSARFNYTTLPKQEYRLAGWLYRSAAAPCRR